MNANADDPTFLGNSAINLNGTWYYAGQNMSWCTGGSFNGGNLGTITTLAIGGKSEAYDRGTNWNSGTVTMGYKIDGGSDQSIGLSYYAFENNNNIFQSGGSTFTSTDINLTGLSCGEHTIEVWFNCGSKFDSNNGKNYKATFTITNTYTRSVISGNFGTICLPFAATVTGATVFEITSKVMDTNDNTKLASINLESVDELVAGRAYIFKATGSEFTATYTGTYTAALTGEAMVGNLGSSAITVPQGNYVVGGDNKIHKVTGDAVTCGQNKSYIDLSKVTTATSRTANFINFEDETTGIENVQAEKSQNVVYNLQGQRVNNAQKGLVIVGGKKMLRK